MNPALLPVLLLFIVVLLSSRTNNGLYFRIIKNKGEHKKMLPKDMLTEFIGKNCQVILFNDSFGVSGTIVGVEDNWVKVEEKSGTRLVNGDMIRDIFLKKQK